MAKKRGKDEEKLNYSAAVRELKADGPERLYLLWGPEDYLREQYLAQLKKICLPEGEDDFSYKRMDGPGLDPTRLREALDAIPFMSERSFVELRNVDINKLANADECMKLLEDIPDYCTVAFVQSTQFEPDGRLKFVKALRGEAKELKFTQQSQGMLTDWIVRRFAAAGKSIELDAAQRLIFISGDLMSRLIPEIDKLAAYAKEAKIVHVDCDPASVGKNVRVDLGIVADVKDVLTTVASRVKPAAHDAWLAQIAEWKKRRPMAYRPLHPNVIMPQRVMEALDRATNGEAILATDVGQHQMWAAQYFRHTHARHFLSSGGMGTMGFGIPAAIGAAIGRPDQKVVAVCGDGGAQMTFEEIVVAVEHKLPITFVVVNNGCLGMVRQWQELFYDKRYSGSILTVKGRLANERLEQDLAYDYLPDLVKLAEAHGAEAYRVIDPAKLDAVLKKAVRSARTTFVEVIVEPRANVYPMQPGGQPVEGMIFE